MPLRNKFPVPTVATIRANVFRNAAKMPTHGGHHDGGSVSLREADYNGHHIAVRTTYEIEVDGRPLTGHMGVTDDGRVHYHPVPNVSFPSAIDMVKRLIDVFPDEFDPQAEPDSHGGDGGHGDHSHADHQHGDHSDDGGLGGAAPHRRRTRLARPTKKKGARVAARRTPRGRRR